jgi:acetyltransferase-like isoleucine patch superfamily enzyme
MPFLISLMGARIGKNLVLMGKVFNPDLIETGDNVLIGDGALLSGHIVHANNLILGKIKIGHDVTIGIGSLILPDVEIGDRAIIAAHAVVKMGTRIPPDQIWGGIPAKKIGETKKSP